MTCATELRSLSYKPGDVLFDHIYPFVKVLVPELREKHCNNCFEAHQELEECSNCKLVRYCTANCKDEDWKDGHKIECTSIFYRNIFSAGLMLVFRLYVKLKINPDEAKKPFRFHDGSNLCLQDLIDADRLKLKKEQQLFTANVIMKQLNRLDNCNLELHDILPLISLIEYTALEISSKDVFRIGLGFYTLYSDFEHSCRPTVVCEIANLKLQIRAIAEIGEGELPRVCISPVIEEKKNMRRCLIKRRNSICNCPLCEPEGGAGIDFKKLNFLINGMQTILKEGNYDAVDWCDIYTKHETVIGMLHKLYYKYDERITNQYMRTLVIGVNLKVSNKLLKELYDQTYEHLLITVGVGNNKYEFFVQGIWSAYLNNLETKQSL